MSADKRMWTNTKKVNESRHRLFLYIVDQAKRSTSGTSPCKNQRYKRIRGRGGIGRLGGFRCCHLREGFSFRHPHRKIKYAGMMELADMQDLGSCAAMRWGSNPHARTTILRQSIFVDCRIFFCFSEHLSILKNPSHHERVTSSVRFASTNSAVLLLSDWLPPYAQRNKVL